MELIATDFTCTWEGRIGTSGRITIYWNQLDFESYAKHFTYHAAYSARSKS